MAKHSESSTTELGADGLFLRAADRKRFDYVMRAVCVEGQCLALSSTNDGVLDHYGRLVINRLRQTPGLLLEVFLPANTEALLDRFNQILAGLSLSDARDAISSPAPRRVLVAHDARAVSSRDLQLLARLMNDFPGANTALVLFLDQSREHQHEKVLESFGQRLLRWPVEAPTRAEGEALLKVGAMLGFGVEIKKLLAATGVVDGPPPKASLFASRLANVRQDGRTEPVLQDPPAQPAPRQIEEKNTFTPPSESSSLTAHKALKTLRAALRWSIATTLLLTVSVVVIVALFPARISPLLATSPLAKAYVPSWVLSAVAGITGTPASISKVAETLAAAPATKPDPAPVPDTEDKAEAATLPGAPDAGPTVSATSVDSQNSEQVVARVEQPARAEPVTRVEPVAPLAPVIKAVPVARPANEAVAKPVTPGDALAPQSESGIDQQVRRAKAGSYFVQHVSLASMTEAQAWRAQYPVLGKSGIVAVNTQSQGVKFAVVSGPFASRKDAEVFTGRPGVPADPWLRPLTSLRKALLPGTR